MGGKVLVLQSDLLIEQGRAQGMEQGMEQGIKRGMEQGIKRGMEQGIKRGMEQGMERGIECGSLLKAKQTAMKMHEKSYQDTTIAELLEYSVETIRSWLYGAEPAAK